MMYISIGSHRENSLSALPVLAAVMIFLLITAQAAGSYIGLKGRGGDVSPSATVVKFHDVNSVSLAVSNTGQIGNDLFADNGHGFWPANTPNGYVFGTGVWIGGLADIDGDGDEDTLLIQAYDPLSGGSEYQEGYYGQATSDPLASVFRSNDAADLENWPAQFSDSTGAPVVMSDQDLVTIYNTVGKTPIFADPTPPIEIRQRSLAFSAGLARQVIFFIFEIENITHRTEGWEPFTLENAWMGYDSDMDIGTVFGDDRTSFFRNQDNLETPETGDSIPINMGFVWDEDFSETNFVGDPGFVGIAYLQSPGNYEDGIDNDLDGIVDESPFNGIDDDGDGEADDQPDEVDQLGLVNYTIHCNSCPWRPDPPSDAEGYRMMACDPPDECAETTESTDVRFLITSGPFTIRPGETHTIVLAFVFANAVGDPTSIPVYGDPPRPDPNDPVFGEFLAVKRAVQGIYDLNFQPSDPPPWSEMKLIPGDGQVTILWDNTPVTAPDPNYEEFVLIDPEYRQYDFEGFRLWRSRTGVFSTAGDPDDPLNPIAQAENEAREELDLTLLGQWDLANGITTIPDGIQILGYVIGQGGDTVVTLADTFDLGTDTGLRFSYIDRGDEGLPLLNGSRYFYSIESYDYNSPALPVSPLSTRTGISFPSENSVIPYLSTDDLEVTSDVSHVDSDGNVLEDETPPEFVFNEPPKATDALRNSSVSTLMDAEIEDTHHTWIVDDIIPDAWENTAEVRYHVEDASGHSLHTGGDQLSLFTMGFDSTLISIFSTVFSPTDTTLPAYELSLEFLADADAYHSPPVSALTAVDSQGNDIKATLGNLQMPQGSFRPRGFRGTDLTIEWHAIGDDTLTLSVYDTGNRLTVPPALAAGDSMRAQNWFFDRFAGQPGGMYLTGSPTVFKLYMCGAVVSPVGVTRRPQEGDVWTLRQRSYYVTMEGDTIPASRPLVPGTRYRLEFSPAEDATPPAFTIGIFQNTILTNDLDIYIVASEEMDTVPELTVAGADVSLAPVESEEVELYAAAYRLTQSGTYTVLVKGEDTWGNEGEASEDFSAGLILRTTGGILVSADQVLRLDVPPQAIREASRYFLCLSEGAEDDGSEEEMNLESHLGFASRAAAPGTAARSRAGLMTHSAGIEVDSAPRRIAESDSDVESGKNIVGRGTGRGADEAVESDKTQGGDVMLSSDIGSPVSPLYLLSPPGEQLEKGADLSFAPLALGLEESDLEGLGIFTWTDEAWLELDSHFDPASNRITTTVQVLGSYQLRSRGPAGSSPLPKVFRLAQNFPNPFNPSTTIGFDIPEDRGEVWTELSIYNVRGQRVRTLLKETKAPGSYSILWNGRGEAGQKLGSGIYFYKIRAGNFVSTRKMVLVK
jgi:hypothetical protein